MKAKLIKREEGYYLFTDESYINAMASNHENWIKIHDGQKLSIKNCEAIERGYDVFELAYDSSKEFLIESTHSPSFTFGYEQGFQKALEILGDKKFSGEDVISMIEKSRKTGLTAEYLIQSLQQTEWDVEVEWEKDTELFNVCPKLDVNGCLILKRL